MGKISVEASEIPRIQKSFVIAWEIVKKYYNISQDDDWGELLRDYKNFSKYGKDQEAVLTEGLAVAVLRFLEERSKG